ncbi:MAG: hypothetical protein LBG28_00635 [Tannerella sp.]|jgi:hypothetical protein|nr:hypothetical protein [Tannerella sp.]
MATNKKRKKTQTQHRDSAILVKNTKTYLDACYTTARRIFRVMGEDAAAFDTFTKRQKLIMFQVQVIPPRIRAMPGHSVPRAYLRYIQEELIAYLKREYFDREAGLTWMNLATTGQILEMLFSLDSFMNKLEAPQLEVVERMNRAFRKRSLKAEIQEMISIQIKSSLMMLSQPNFRIYGQCISQYLQSPVDKYTLQTIVHIITHECRSLRFNYHNRERKAFRVAIGQFMDVPYIGATIAMSKIYPNIEHDRRLNIYIQSHAIHRFKERIDTFYPIMRNQFFVISLMMAQKVVRGASGLQLIACIAPVDGGEYTLGYFAFTIDNDNLLVLTLLPLLSESVPEGRILCERLHLSIGDLNYLGMDKLSFFYDVDIEQIPALKRVLFDELHLDYIRREVHNSFRPPNSPFDEKKTLFVKNFFQKFEEQPADHAEVLSDLARFDT